MKGMILLGLMSSVVAVTDDEKAELGKPVPKFSLKDTEGKDVGLEDFRKAEGREGKIVVVVFWSFRCPAGSRIMDDLAEFSKFCREKDVVLVGVCSYGESAEEIAAYRKEHGIDYPLWIDPKCSAADLFGTEVVTSSYLLGKDGTLLYRGAYRQQVKRVKKFPLRDSLEEVLAGKVVSNSETRPTG